MTSAIYIRVSTEEQAKEGYSCAAQENILRAWSTIKGCAEPRIYIDDGYSAKNLNRPAIRQMLSDCRSGLIGAVIVWRLDRLSRSLRDTLEMVEDIFRANDVEFVSATENIDTSSPSGRLTLNILASVAQNEREVTEQRVRTVCEEIARTECRHLGGVPPYGYSVDDALHYIIEPQEARAITLIFDMYASGCGYGAIIKALNAHGHNTRKGEPFRKTALHDILKNEKYTGTYIYNKAAPARRDGTRNSHAQKESDKIIKIPGGMPRIIDDETWKDVQRRMAENKHNGGSFRAKREYMLSGLVYCGECGRHMVLNTRGKDRNGTVQKYYECANNDVRRIRLEKLEKAVLDFIAQLSNNEDILRRACEIANEAAERETASSEAELSAIRQELEDIASRTKTIIDFIATAGANAPASLADELNALDARKADLGHQLRAACNNTDPIDAAAIVERIKKASHIADLDPHMQRQAIHQIVRRVDVYTDKVIVRLLTSNDTNGGGVALPVVSLVILIR